MMALPGEHVSGPPSPVEGEADAEHEEATSPAEEPVEAEQEEESPAEPPKDINPGKRALTDDDSTKPEADSGHSSPAAKRLKSESPLDFRKSDSPKVEENGKPLNLNLKESEDKSASYNGSEEKSSDSDKENQDDAPMDLTVKPLGKSDLVEEGCEEEGKEESRSERKRSRAALVRRLQAELRNEEAKLVLLKKIRQSQLVQHLGDPSQVSAAAAAANAAKGLSAPRPQGAAPPPLVRGSPGLNTGKPSSNSHSQLVRQGQNSSGPPPLIMAPRNGSQSSNGRSAISQSQASSIYRSLQAHGRTATPPQQPEQTPAQRQAAAKLALRKQLEKTLLQIPPPKPPPPEMNFIPSLIGNEFIMLVGLEEVVKHITDSDARAKGEKADVKYVFNPFTCVQCSTDFTPVWKRDRPGSRSVICETCVTSNQKKALKQEHTNRLKSAFVKALQQEQEIEQRMQQQQQQQQQAAQQKQESRQRESSRERERERDRDKDKERERERERGERERELAAQQAAHMTALTAHHAMAAAAAAGLNLGPLNLTSAMKATPEQLRQHQNLLQAHQAQLRAPPGLAFNPRAMFPFLPNLGKADLQRQYLLDMIPRSLPGGSSLWKT